MTERELQKECIKWCNANGVWCLNLHQAGWTGRGQPDLILCVDGLFAACELKVQKNQPSLIQKKRREKILTAGGTHFYAWSLNEFVEHVNHLRPIATPKTPKVDDSSRK